MNDGVKSIEMDNDKYIKQLYCGYTERDTHGYL